MIRILHSADLHLGKTLHERDITRDQSAMLAALLDRAITTRADALLLAGDIYDRSIPPPDAVRLFDEFLTALYKARPGILTIAIPGNHDSAARLSFGSSLLAATGLHIRTTAACADRPVILTKDGQTCRFWPLPFLGAASLLPSRSPESRIGTEGQSSVHPEPESRNRNPTGEPAQAQPQLQQEAQTARILSQSELLRQAVGIITGAGAKVRKQGGTDILIAHCFVTGGTVSESERSFVGTAEQVEASLFDGFDYVALGHLHRCQSPGSGSNAGSSRGSICSPSTNSSYGSGPSRGSSPSHSLEGRIHYPGSPLAYSFGESGQEKGFLLADIHEESPGNSRLSLDFLPHAPLHSMRRIRGSFAFISGNPGIPAGSVRKPEPLSEITPALLPGMPGSTPEAPENSGTDPGSGGQSGEQTGQDVKGPLSPAEPSEDYIEAILTDSNPVLNPLETLRSRYPNILSVRQLCFEADPALRKYSPDSPDAPDLPDGSGSLPLSLEGYDPLNSVLSDFQSFHLRMKNSPPDQSLLDLFTSIAKEAADETP